jgi:hypothetical protein
MCHLSNKHTRQFVLRYREGKRYFCNAYRMILRFFLDIVNGQEAQQIIIKLTAFKMYLTRSLLSMRLSFLSFLIAFCLQKIQSTIKNESEHDIAFNKFLDILQHDLFENKKAFTMSSLLDKFCSLLPEGLSTKYSTAKLQTRLQNHYGDTQCMS